MNPAAEIVLGPLGTLYGAATRARLALYRTGTLPSYKIDAPVISVGNITTGGTGKTPLVEWIARAVSRDAARVCILTRGYGRSNSGQRVLVSDGEQVLAGADDGGDEPRLLAEALRGVAAVISDRDRVAAARWALSNLRSEAFILDDGFQHLRIARDLDLVTLDATDPWGGGRLLPRGRLREPPGGLARADCVIITRADQVENVHLLSERARRLSGGRPLLFSRTRTVRLRPLSSDFTDKVGSHVDSLPEPVAAFCAVGNPQSFFAQVRGEGYALNFARAFPDHHAYTRGEVETLVNEAEKAGARAILTTAKDAVKLRSLRFKLPCYVLDVAIELDDQSLLLNLIRDARQRGAQRKQT